MAYNKTNWEALPSTNTPIIPANLNKIENELEALDTSVTSLKTNRILWQDNGGSFMNENQTAYLSENVSAQNNGIVLVFSAYSDGESHDYGWYEYFIPKKVVELQGGNGHSILIPDNSYTYGVKASKYIYVSNDHLTGNANNVGTHGNLNNSSVVLRYVIGI